MPALLFVRRRHTACAASMADSAAQGETVLQLTAHAAVNVCRCSMRWRRGQCDRERRALELLPLGRRLIAAAYQRPGRGPRAPRRPSPPPCVHQPGLSAVLRHGQLLPGHPQRAGPSLRRDAGQRPAAAKRGARMLPRHPRTLRK